MSGQSAGRGVTQSVLRVVKGNRLLRRPAGWVSRRVATSDESSLLRKALGPVRDRMRGSMSVADVHRIMDALAAAEVPVYLAGGWGIDALAGRQTRSHDDLDVVVDDYDARVDDAVSALAALGFVRVAEHNRRAWMPRSVTVLDPSRLRVELLSINWRILAEAYGPEGSGPETRPAFEAHVFSTGTIGGRRVPCLSADVQLAYHSEFELKPAMRGDVSILVDELGARLPWE